MTFLILGSLALGIIFGFFLIPLEDLQNLSEITRWALALLLFTIGADLAQGKDLLQRIKGLPKIAVAIPFLVAVGSLLGTFLVSPFLALSRGEGALVGAGFGWYSLSALLIAQAYDLTLGTLSLLTNVLREVFAIVCIPFVACRLGSFAAVAPGGATSMDVGLPIIARSTDRQTTLLALYSGTILSLLVPFLIPLLIRLMH